MTTSFALSPNTETTNEQVAPPAYRVNSVINDDCLRVLSRMKEASVDLTAFSPPYDSIRDYKNNWDFDFSALGKALHSVTKDGGICAAVIEDGGHD